MFFGGQGVKYILGIPSHWFCQTVVFPNDLPHPSVPGVWERSTQQHDREVLRPASVYHSGLTSHGDGDQAESVQ